MATFLIIDDKEVFAKNTAGFLEQSGHAAFFALTGTAGIKLMADCAPQAIVLDYRPPDMDGATLISRLRAVDGNVPILVLSGVASIELAVEAIKAGADDFLIKPLSLTSLRERLSNLANRQRETRLEHAGAPVLNANRIDAIRGSSLATGAARNRNNRVNRFDQAEHSLLMLAGLSLPG